MRTMLVLSDTVYANKDHRTVNSSLGRRHYVHSSSSAHIQTISTLPLLVYLYTAPPQLSLWYALFRSYLSWWLQMKTSASFCHKKTSFTYNALSVTLNCWPWVFELIHLYYLHTLHLHQSTCLSILSCFYCLLFLLFSAHLHLSMPPSPFLYSY